VEFTSPDDMESDSDSSSEEEEEDERYPKCCCGCRCTPHVALIVCMSFISVGIYGFAVWYGFRKMPTLEQLLHPSTWVEWPPYLKSTEENFAVFDRDKDGFISTDDIAEMATIKDGVRPSDKQLKAYIGKADMDGDGRLNQAEYVELVRLEREEKKAKEAEANKDLR